jgi:hypothetical protein
MDTAVCLPVSITPEADKLLSPSNPTIHQCLILRRSAVPQVPAQISPAAGPELRKGHWLVSRSPALSDGGSKAQPCALLAKCASA